MGARTRCGRTPNGTMQDGSPSQEVAPEGGSGSHLSEIQPKPGGGCGSDTITQEGDPAWGLALEDGDHSLPPLVFQVEPRGQEPGLLDALFCRSSECCRTDCPEGGDENCCVVREGECVVRQWTPYAEEVRESSTEAVMPEPALLCVPEAFDRLRLAYIVSTDHVDGPGEDGPAEDEEQRRILQAVVQGFVRALLRGVLVSLVLDDGTSLPAVCSLDRRLEVLEIQARSSPEALPEEPPTVSSKPHYRVEIPLRDISMVCTQEEIGVVREAIPGGGFLDSSCVALVLSGRRFLALSLEDPRVREYFEVSLGVLVDGRGSPRSRQEEDVMKLLSF